MGFNLSKPEKITAEPKKGTILIVGTIRKDKRKFFEICKSVAENVIFLAEEMAVWPFLSELSDHIVPIKAEFTFESVYDDLANYLTKEEIKLDGITTYMDDWLDLVGFLCGKFDIPEAQHTSFDIYNKVRDKYSFRQICNEMDVFQTCECQLVDFEASNFDPSSVKLPCIIKPQRGSGSMFTKKIRDKSELEETMQTLSEQFDQFDNGSFLKKIMGKKFMIEELVMGEEFDVDGYCIDSEVVICYVNWNQETDEFGNEYGGLYPASFSEEEHEKIKSAISALLQKLGKITSFFHIEGILTKDSTVFPLEFNIRMAGAEAPCIFKFMTGLHPAKVTAQLALGLQVPPVQWETPKGFVRSTNERCDSDGVVTDIKISKELENSPWYVGHSMYVEVGQKYTSAYNGNVGTLYWLAAHGDTPEEASEHLDKLKEFIVVTITPNVTEGKATGLPQLGAGELLD